MPTPVEQALERDNYCCKVCGTNQNVCAHHIQYRSRGGGNVADNYATLCVHCHEAVHAKRISLHFYQVDNHLELFIQRHQ